MKVDKLVEQFLAAQSLKILPQAPFGDAVTQFVEKDDKRAMELFVNEALSSQVSEMLALGNDDEDLESAMERFRDKLENKFKAGAAKQARRIAKVKPRPDNWDSDLEGPWEQQPRVFEVEEVPAENPTTRAKPATARGRGRKAAAAVAEDEDEEMNDFADDMPAPKSRGRGKTAAKPTTAKPATAKAAAKKPPARGRGRKAAIFEEDSDEEEEEDVFMDADEPDAPPPRRQAPTRSQPPRTQSARTQPSRAAASGSKARQTKLNFSQSQTQSQHAMEISDDEISDDDDPFESVPAVPAPRSRRR